MDGMFGVIRYKISEVEMLLGKRWIQRALRWGWIYCNPKPNVVTETSFDISLGSDFWKLRDNIAILNPTDSAIMYYQHIFVEEFTDLWLPPAEMYIGSTEEFCGTTVPFIVPFIRTKSTFRRWGLDIAMSACVGEPGFRSRWALELYNSHNVPVLIRPGWHVGQMSFLWSIGCTKYNRAYNKSEDEWSADILLPKSFFN